jgi:polysaccharide biosynthesis/export protein
MGGGPSVAGLRDIQTLFDTGTAIGLSDRQLLERFLNGRDASAEAAFQVLVQRHGPMVLRVCRNVLGDATDAQDAFQATFLVLVRRSGSIRRLESLGSWLFGVACRVAARARVEAARRRAAERRGALRVVQAFDPSEGDDQDRAEFGPVVQEEVRRLPEKYRAVVALCYWQGLTQEQAATQLGCPLGTVRSRLARARGQLHKRLTRRGLGPVAGVVAAAFDGSSTSASVSAAASRLSAAPPKLVHATIRAAVQVAAGKGTNQAVTALTASLVQAVVWNMTLVKISKMMTILSLASLVVVGVSLWARQPDLPRGLPPSPRVVKQKPKRTEETKSGPAPVVGPSDLIDVEVLDALPGRPVSGERVVRPDGTISLGLYGDVHVAGLNLPEIKEKIVLRMRRYLSDVCLGLTEDEALGVPFIDEVTKDPRLLDPKDTDKVFVDVTGYNSGVYYVQGDVSMPARLAYTGNDTVLDVIHYVGGLLPSADRSKIRLIRSFPKGSAVTVLPIDYEEIAMGTDHSTNYKVLPNDRLVVPRTPDHPSQKSASTRTFQPSPSAAQTRHAPTRLTASPDAKQLDSLHELERHADQVEKKLDKLIEELESVKKTEEENVVGNATPEPCSPASVDPTAESGTPIKPK